MVACYASACRSRVKRRITPLRPPAIGLLSQGTPIVRRVTEQALGFAVRSVVRWFVALGASGAKIFCLVQSEIQIRTRVWNEDSTGWPIGTIRKPYVARTTSGIFRDSARRFREFGYLSFRSPKGEPKTQRAETPVSSGFVGRSAEI
jgi:hypothetical protein